MPSLSVVEIAAVDAAPMILPRTLRISQVAEILQVDRRTVGRLIDSGAFDVVSVTKTTRRITAESLKKYIENRTQRGWA